MAACEIEIEVGDRILRASWRPGDAPAMLLVHGNSSHRGVWHPLLEVLHRPAALAIDLRGHGRSDWADPPAYATADYAHDIAAATRRLGDTRFVLVGHSNGALAALHHAVYGSPKPAALILIDIDPRIPDDQIAYFRQRAGAVARAYESAERIARGQATVDPAAPYEAFLAHVRGMIDPVEGGVRMRLDPQSYSAWAPADLTGATAHVPCPLLTIRGADSFVSSREAMTRMADDAACGRLVEIEKAGHFPMLAQPEATADAIRAFLDEVVVSTG